MTANSEIVMDDIMDPTTMTTVKFVVGGSGCGEEEDQTEEEGQSDDDEDYSTSGTNVVLTSSLSNKSTNGSTGIRHPRKSTTTTPTVKFAMDEHQDDILHDTLSDQQRTKVQLLEKISRLTSALQETQRKYDTEREKSKKKGKNLIKLAKELKKRSTQKDADQDRLEELEEKKKYLEHHWVLAQKELDQEKVLRAKIQAETDRELDRAIEEERNRYQKAVSDHESRLVEIRKSHQVQCDELSHEILKATLEADRLSQELESKGVYVPRRAMFHKDNNESSKWSNVTFVISVMLTTIVCVTIWYGSSVDMFTKRGMCSPIMPGSSLTRQDMIEQNFVAPWWTPTPYKRIAFNKLCATSTNSDGDDKSTSQKLSDVSPTTIQWMKDGSKTHKFILSVDDKVRLRLSLSKVDISGTTFHLWRRNGHAEEVPLPW